jgi:hypothetical protein
MFSNPIAGVTDISRGKYGRTPGLKRLNGFERRNCCAGLDLQAQEWCTLKHKFLLLVCVAG